MVVGGLQGGELGSGFEGGGGGGFGGEGGLGGFVGGALEDFFEIHALGVELGGEEVGVFEADVVEFHARDVVGESVVVVVVVVGSRWLGGGGREFDEFAVGFVLDDAVDVAVSFVVPDSLGGHVHCERVAALGEMAVGVGFVVAAAADVSTNEADPEIGV